MVELQILNKVLKEKSLNIIFQNGLGEEHFLKYRDEYNFITNHYEQYSTVPDEITIMDEFSDFEPFECTESNRYLVEKIKEAHLYSFMVPVLNKTAEVCLTDSKQAVDYILSQLPEIIKLMGGFNEGYDLAKNAMERLVDYKARCECDGLLGISSGMPELDEILHGWLAGEDLITIVGRTNEGKSWVLLYFLTVAWLAGKKILLYSGEMGRLMVGYRFDTLSSHFSNLGLMTGKKELGGLSSQEYEEWLIRLSKCETQFIIVTPKDFGGKQLTVPMLNGLIEKYKPDIVGIDQFSLMDDARYKKGDAIRIQLAHVAEDLYNSSERYGIPIIADAQASRKANEKRKGETEADAPELDEIGEADAIGQNSSRVISIKKSGAGLKVVVKKNRYGLNNIELLYFWDIDKGHFKFIPTSESSGAQARQEADEEFQDGTELF